MTKRFGFTLAEVLITLGIIGVVAAMTIPTLMSNTADAQFKTAFKKSLSVMNQAVLMQLALADTDYSNIVAEGTDNENTVGSMAELLNARMNSATPITDAWKSAAATDLSIPAFAGCTEADVSSTAKPECTTVQASVAAIPATSTDLRVYQFADNTAFGYVKTSHDCTQAAPCLGFIDVNGAKRPNQLTVADGDNVTINDIFPVIYYDQTVRPDEAGIKVLGQ